MSDSHPEHAAHSETSPAADVVLVEDPTPIGWLHTTDHKRIGRLYVVTALLVLVGGLVLDGLVRLDLTDGSDFVVFDAETFAQAFVLSRDVLVLLFAVPLFMGFAMYLVPLQIGAGNLAFPRAALLSYWAWLLSSGLLVGAYLANGGPYGGEFDGVDLYLVASGAVALSLMLGAVCVATTALTMRSPELYLDETPVFTWSSLVTSVMLLLTLPVLLAQLLLLTIDHRNGRLYLGGNFGIYDKIDWLFRTPELFLLVVPALGIIGEIVSARAGCRQVQPKAVQIAIGAVGLFGFGAYANLTLEGDLVAGMRGGVLAVMHVGALVAVLVLAGLWGATLAKGTGMPRLDTAFLGATGAMVLVLLLVAYSTLGVLVDWANTLDLPQFLQDITERDVPLYATTWVGAVFTLAIGSLTLAGFAGLHWWAPKMWGRKLSEPLGMLSGLAVLGGTFVASIGAALSGLLADQPDFVHTDPNLTTLYADLVGGDLDTAEALSMVAFVGVLLMLAGAALMALSVVLTAVRRGADVPNDPWDAQTPEWDLPSPPPIGPPAVLPDLTSGTPVLDRREPGLDRDGPDGDVKELEEVTS
jgi:heme/copper-type cytochrome/quinol oxidase subunit 1